MRRIGRGITDDCGFCAAGSPPQPAPPPAALQSVKGVVTSADTCGRVQSQVTHAGPRRLYLFLSEASRRTKRSSDIHGWVTGFYALSQLRTKVRLSHLAALRKCRNSSCWEVGSWGKAHYYVVNLNYWALWKVWFCRGCRFGFLLVPLCTCSPNERVPIKTSFSYGWSLQVKFYIYLWVIMKIISLLYIMNQKDYSVDARVPCSLQCFLIMGKLMGTFSKCKSAPIPCIKK